MFALFVFSAFIIAAAIVAAMGGRNLECAAIEPVASKKHVRIAYWSDGYRFTYYNSDGRKVTSRKGIAASDVDRLRKLAHSRGYSSIVF